MNGYPLFKIIRRDEIPIKGWTTVTSQRRWQHCNSSSKMCAFGLRSRVRSRGVSACVCVSFRSSCSKNRIEKRLC